LTRPLRVLLSWSMLVSCTSLFILGCSAFNAPPMNTHPDLQEPSPEKQNLFPADRLTSLEVVVDACFVSVEPKKKSPTFGPLTRGEVVKWLDAQDNWIRVWIPRLRISGWVLQSGVEEIQDTNANQPLIPENEITTMIVVSEKTKVRDVPTTKSDVILIADKGDAFFLLREREGWCRVWLPEQNRTGWIFGRSLVRKGEK
jgi:uncharacterized protein YgiM (DUF1202 family)